MKTFDVYKHPTQGYQAVKQGFGWPAFFFSVIWAFIKKMWGLGFVFFGVISFLSFLEVVVNQEGSDGGVLLILLAQLGAYLIFGFNANEWRRGNLEKRGYRKLDSIKTKTPESAIALMTENYAGSRISIGSLNRGNASAKNGRNSNRNSNEKAEAANNVEVKNNQYTGNITTEVNKEYRMNVDEDLTTPDFYAQAWDEVESKTFIKSIWARIYSESGGDEKITRAGYIKERVAQLEKEYGLLKEERAKSLKIMQEEKKRQEKLRSIKMDALKNLKKEEVKLKTKGGILVCSVEKGASSETLGIKAGDVIVSINDNDIRNDESLYYDEIEKIREKGEGSMLLFRGNEPHDIRPIECAVEGLKITRLV